VREDRSVVFLPGERLAWFPHNTLGAARLARERRVLDLIGRHCAFDVPRIRYVASAGWDLRAAVPGSVDPWGLYMRLKGDGALATRIGRDLGRMLAGQHTNIGADLASDWLPAMPNWPLPTRQLAEPLAAVVEDPALLDDLLAVLRAYDAVPVSPADRVLCHADLGLHNIAVDDGRVRGIFDYDGASWSDRHHDFRYLVFDDAGDGLLKAAIEIYEPATGYRLDRSRIRLYNLACAIGFLADRHGTPASGRPAGRTLAEDLRWVRHGLDRLAARPE